MDCQESHPPYVMDFDHLDPTQKEFDLSNGAGYSLKRILAEIAKCEVVCSNCHRKRTYSRMSS